MSMSMYTDWLMRRSHCHTPMTHWTRRPCRKMMSKDVNLPLLIRRRPRCRRGIAGGASRPGGGGIDPGRSRRCGERARREDLHAARGSGQRMVSERDIVRRAQAGEVLGQKHRVIEPLAQALDAGRFVG